MLFESIGTQFALIYGGWAAACALVLAGIALYDSLTIKSNSSETADQGEPGQSTFGSPGQGPRLADGI